MKEQKIHNILLVVTNMTNVKDMQDTPKAYGLLHSIHVCIDLVDSRKLNMRHYSSRLKSSNYKVTGELQD